MAKGPRNVRSAVTEADEPMAAAEGRDLEDTKALEDVVAALFAERFPEARVNHVVVRQDRDFDGDRILRITVVMASGVDTLDQMKLLGFVPALRPVRRAALGGPVVAVLKAWQHCAAHRLSVHRPRALHRHGRQLASAQ